MNKDKSNGLSCKILTIDNGFEKVFMAGNMEDGQVTIR